MNGMRERKCFKGGRCHEEDTIPLHLVMEQPKYPRGLRESEARDERDNRVNEGILDSAGALKETIKNVGVEQCDDLQQVFVDYHEGFRVELPEGAGHISGCVSLKRMS